MLFLRNSVSICYKTKGKLVVSIRKVQKDKKKRGAKDMKRKWAKCTHFHNDGLSKLTSSTVSEWEKKKEKNNIQLRGNFPLASSNDDV